MPSCGSSDPTCQTCEAGYFNPDGCNICGPCANGSYSSAGWSSCGPCPENTYSGQAAATCLPCPPGECSGGNAATCVPCAPPTPTATTAASSSVSSSATTSSSVLSSASSSVAFSHSPRPSCAATPPVLSPTSLGSSAAIIATGALGTSVVLISAALVVWSCRSGRPLSSILSCVQRHDARQREADYSPLGANDVRHSHMSGGSRSRTEHPGHTPTVQRAHGLINVSESTEDPCDI